MFHIGLVSSLMTKEISTGQWNLEISIILVAVNLLHFLQIRKNGQSKVQNFASEIDMKK